MCWQGLAATGIAFISAVTWALAAFRHSATSVDCRPGVNRPVTTRTSQVSSKGAGDSPLSWRSLTMWKSFNNCVCLGSSFGGEWHDALTGLSGQFCSRQHGRRAVCWFPRYRECETKVNGRRQAHCCRELTPKLIWKTLKAAQNRRHQPFFLFFLIFFASNKCYSTTTLRHTCLLQILKCSLEHKNNIYTTASVYS